MPKCEAPGCGADIIFIPVRKAAGGLTNTPLNVEPDPTGNVIVAAAGARLIGRIKHAGEVPRDDEALYLPHFATCTRPTDYRKARKPVTPAAPVPPGDEPIGLFL